MFALERSQIFLTHWQVAGHTSDIPAPGDWLSFDMLGERGLVMRGQDGVIRAFHNLCRHRGARVVDGVQPSVKAMLAPYDADFAAYDLENVLSVNLPDWGTTLPVNWKSVRDVDNEGYHVAMAHPGLQDLYGRTYRDLSLPDGLTVSIGYFGDAPGRLWSVKHYVNLSPQAPHLPPHLQKAWSYYGIFPNAVFAFTPEAIQFSQEIPISPTETRVTGRLYRRPNETRAQRVARYLAYRIDRETSTEDQQLSIWSNESMKSQAFEGFHLSDLEYGVRRHHDGLRRLLPVMHLQTAPKDDEIAAMNAEMLGRSAAMTQA